MDQHGYTYAQVRQRIRDELHIDVSSAELRQSPRPGQFRSRVTHEMPEPDPAFVDPIKFDAAAIDHWLEHHPRRRQTQALQALSVSDVAGREALVVDARHQGVSWKRIAEAISAADDRPYSTQAVFKRYRHSAG